MRNIIIAVTSRALSLFPSFTNNSNNHHHHYLLFINAIPLNLFVSCLLLPFPFLSPTFPSVFQFFVPKKSVCNKCFVSKLDNVRYVFKEVYTPFLRQYQKVPVYCFCILPVLCIVLLYRSERNNNNIHSNTYGQSHYEEGTSTTARIKHWEPYDCAYQL